MSAFAWSTRRIGGLSLVALLALIYWVFSTEIAYNAALKRAHKVPLEAGVSYEEVIGDAVRRPGFTAYIYAFYSLLVHTLTFCFPIRACWAVWDLTRSIKKASRTASLTQLKYSYSLSRRFSSTSLSSAETLTTQTSQAASEAGDSEYFTDATEVEKDKVIHAILIPNYKENIDGLRETLDVLASHAQARFCYDVYLGMEERETGAEKKALTLAGEYRNSFRTIDYTLHPGNIIGEAPGKSSNIAWGAREASKRYPIRSRNDVIITGIDADSHLSSNYFALVTSMHIEHPATCSTTLYAAPIIFDRNAHLVSALVRVADVLWCAAGLSGQYSGSIIRPPTSVYSIPLELADRVGGWDTDPEAIGEDLHMYLKCFYALNGHLTTRTVLSPVSQSNVSSGEGSGWAGQLADNQARYKQAMRHMWGALDSGFAIRKTVELWETRKNTVKSFRPLHASSVPVYWQPVHEKANTDLSQSMSEDEDCKDDMTHEKIQSPNWIRAFYLLHRLFEAHFLPSHMAILVISSVIYMYITKDGPDPLGLAWTFALTDYLRSFGFFLTGAFILLYERYHQVCVESREAEMIAAGLADGMKGSFSYRTVRRNLLDYCIFPAVAPIYATIPALHAQFSHFFTLDLVYAVSAKPLRLPKAGVAALLPGVLSK